MFPRNSQVRSRLVAPRAVRIAAYASWAFIAAGTLVSGCASKDTPPAAKASEEAGIRSPNAALTEGDGAPATRKPLSEFDSGAPAQGEYCSALVAAECDGNEDCPSGQTCCGTLNGSGGGYDSIKCQDTCDSSAGGIELCHPGDACPMPADAAAPDGSANVCRRSLYLPAYLAICNPPSSLLPTEFVGKPKAAHEINCGPNLTCGAGTKCCVLGNWDAMTKAISPRDGYCAPLDETCDCDKAPLDGG